MEGFDVLVTPLPPNTQISGGYVCGCVRLTIFKWLERFLIDCCDANSEGQRIVGTHYALHARSSKTLFPIPLNDRPSDLPRVAASRSLGPHLNACKGRV
eukprot:4691278-Amphidinium_carterae.1